MTRHFGKRLSLGLLMLAMGMIAYAQPRRFQVLPDTLLASPTRAVPDGRVNPLTGHQQAGYRSLASVAWQGNAEATARAFLRQEAGRFGWYAPDRTLQLHQLRVTARATHLRFQQTLKGIPVWGRYVQINLNQAGQPTLVLNGYDAQLESWADRFEPSPGITALTALTRARQILEQAAAPVSEPLLVVWPVVPPRLAWQFVLWPEDRPEEWAVVVDAHSGELIAVWNQATHAQPGKTVFPNPLRVSTPLPVGWVTGEGLVFDPDPLATAGVPYGGAYADHNDADTPELNAERRRVTLPEITRHEDGLYRLEGPYVRITGNLPGVADAAYDPPAEPTPEGFRYTRSDPRFEAVMAYYHIDFSQRYLQQLAIGTPVQEAPLPVNPRGLSTDNSMYYPSANAIAFGTGGVDDAEDAAVIWHEYWHALLEDMAPGLLNTNEGKALHEGWADYWAASYARWLAETGAVRRTDWNFLFRWDSGDGTIWEGRRIAFEGHYPQNTNCDREDQPQGLCNPYRDGLLWATVLMEIQDVLGKSVTDRLAVAAALYLSPPATFRDAAQALLQADMDYYGGAHLGALIDRLGARGLIDPASLRLVVRHDPSRDVEITPTALIVRTYVTARMDSVVRVQAFYLQNGRFLPSAFFRPVRDSLFEGQIPWDGTPGQIFYYLEAETAGGWQLRQPLQAPAQTFAVAIGHVAETNVLHVLQANAGWVQSGAQWRIRRPQATPATLVLLPVDLALNAQRLRLHLRHAFYFGEACNGLLEGAADGGYSWQVLLPEGASSSKRPFGDASPPEGIWHTFDLSAYAGRTLWLRASFQCSGEIPEAFWELDTLSLEQASIAPTLQLQRQTQLWPPFPNPFRTVLTLAYTLARMQHVQLVVYDLLGREVARLVDTVQPEGTYAVTFRPNGLAAGVYWVRLLTESTQQTVSIIYRP